MDELKTGDCARIILFTKKDEVMKNVEKESIDAGCIITILSCVGNIVFKSNDKTFVISKNLARTIRVIMVNNDIRTEGYYE